ncbi:hypothetical protein [Pseudoxanthomonas yeongjuensis]|uniref:hypothetical protein n=1 Tax=Pseudoxanthomonas yeongjuensis TaxID=377616 RepID=UPI001391B419|nr:hypothetical protein [Pseudoxanthomonas yeongjuensis]
MTEPAPSASEPASEAQPAPMPPRYRLFELLIGAGVLLISAVSVFVAYSANRTQERMLAASVWPSLVFGTSDLAQDGSPQLSIDLLNRGVGPARVRWAEVLYAGKPVAGPSALLAACCGDQDTTPDASIVSSAIQRRVIGADEWIQAMRVPPSSTSPAVYAALTRSLPGVGMRLCYCSVLDECWLLDSKHDEPEPVRDCKAAPAVLWGSGA